MQRNKLPYILYIASTALFLISIILVPFLQMGNNPLAAKAYPLYHLGCHQINSRSLCIFLRGGTYSLEDCTKDSSVLDWRMTPTVEKDDAIGYKLPVCARDVGIYTGLLVGGLLFPLFGRVERKEIPPPWLFVILLMPMAIDGTSQLLTLYESSNIVRILTGLTAGVVVPFYLIPILNEFYTAFFEVRKA
ncbi:MAG: DUF2085 domain-containing protein [Candidatus Anstonellales archaeon]